ncbi:MAG: Maf family protein [Myxococcota bacterium]
MSDFILASRSPRRKALLEQLGLSPQIVPSDVDESVEDGEAPVIYAQRVAWAKAEACVSSLPVLASDTVVALDGRSLGKAEGVDAARAMLQALSGRTHYVHTAVVVRGLESASTVVTAEVSFRSLGRFEVERYLETDEPWDKAGAYGIQGLGGAFVEHIEGSYSGVVGLPITETLRLLALNGVHPPEATRK